MEEVRDVVKFYVTQIRLGNMDVEDVPDVFRDKVKSELKATSIM